MRRLQVIEAMNYAERRGWTYALSYNPAFQYQMTFYTAAECSEIIEFLLERGMPINPKQVSPSGHTIQ